MSFHAHVVYTAGENLLGLGLGLGRRSEMGVGIGHRLVGQFLSPHQFHDLCWGEFLRSGNRMACELFVAQFVDPREFLLYQVVTGFPMLCSNVFRM